jgi:hypothetical protein
MNNQAQPILGSSLGRALAPYPNASNILPFKNPTNMIVPTIGAVNNESGISKTLIGISFFLGVAIGGYVVWTAKPYIDGYKRIKNIIERDDDEDE